MEEGGVTSLHARIVERSEHSGPTVSQTVNRIEYDDPVYVLGDRRLELIPEGRRQATEVVRKYHLAERLLIDATGLEWQCAHEEACRWEHIMSDTVEERLVSLLEDPKTDPYGNPVPGSGESLPGELLELAVETHEGEALRLLRIGEPIQADKEIITNFATCEMKLGTQVEIIVGGNFVRLHPLKRGIDMQGFKIPMAFASHPFVML